MFANFLYKVRVSKCLIIRVRVGWGTPMYYNVASKVYDMIYFDLKVQILEKNVQ